MARKTTKNAVIDPNSVNITDFCQNQGINEQIFRLELMQHSDSADSDKIVAFDVAQQVASTIAATTKALPQTTETTENVTQTESQTSPETAPNQPQKPQNTNIVASGSNSPSAPNQGQNKPLPSALDELIASAEDDINLADLVLVYRNQQIAANTQTRDNELVAQLRERRIDRRNQVFDHLRDLNSRQPQSPELPELPQALTDEIAALSNELGKELKIG